MLAYVSAAGTPTVGHLPVEIRKKKKEKQKRSSCQMLSQATSRNTEGTNYVNSTAALIRFEFQFVLM